MSAQEAPEVTRESIDDYVRRIVDGMPPLTEEQRARLRVLLRPAKGGASA